jgi:chitinase
MGVRFPRFRRIFPALLIAALALSGARSLAYRFPLSVRHHRPLLVGYFTNSSLFSPTPFFVKDLVTSGSAARLDQIDDSAASVQGGRCSLADPLADLLTPYAAKTSVNGQADAPGEAVRGYFHQFEELKRLYPKLKILISLEGRASDFAFDAQPANRRAFVRSCVDLYLRGEFAEGIHRPGIFDGIDIDWEFPHRSDAANFEALIKEFRRQMDAVHPGLRLCVALGQSPHMLPGTDWAALAPLVDEFGVMNYDYWGPWFKTTGLIAPLFSSAGPHRRGDIQRSLAAYEAAGVPRSKMLMGLPFYGYGWTAVSDANEGLYQKGQPVWGDWPYRTIRTLAQPGSVFRDPRSQAPWIYNGQDFWTFEDPVSVHYKVSYAARQRLGGVMIWELSGDTAHGDLMESAWLALHHPLRNRVFVRAEHAAMRNAATVAQR